MPSTQQRLQDQVQLPAVARNHPGHSLLDAPRKEFLDGSVPGCPGSTRIAGLPYYLGHYHTSWFYD